MTSPAEGPRNGGPDTDGDDATVWRHRLFAAEVSMANALEQLGAGGYDAWTAILSRLDDGRPEPDETDTEGWRCVCLRALTLIRGYFAQCFGAEGVRTWAALDAQTWRWAEPRGRPHAGADPAAAELARQEAAAYPRPSWESGIRTGGAPRQIRRTLSASTADPIPLSQTATLECSAPGAYWPPRATNCSVIRDEGIR
ncbi:hypothetical protein B4N89_00330 [Embleya scabrispora]|uniref:Uncharacterized protein n=1 Tax=Embleya scabrispora TaxID=159449 RepID=A0A1T3NRZ4_9ACTN|nr:hypothetical protein [Embleya scabrispora]OPC79599.1 hypothetical protein B4N89_00330 [Embleya scabrispora]